MFHRGEIITVTITGYAFGGNGVAKIPTEEGDFVVFVTNTFPGQVVQAKVDKKEKTVLRSKTDPGFGTFPFGKNIRLSGNFRSSLHLCSGRRAGKGEATEYIGDLSEIGRVSGYQRTV